MDQTPLPASQVTILLIEDNREHSRFLKGLLGSSSFPKYEVVAADSLAEGIGILHSQTVDLVILDLALPDSRGFATFEKFSAESNEVPIVVLSGVSDVSTAIQTLQKGAQDYLVKGHVDNDNLLRSVHYSLERKRAQVALTRAMEQLEIRVQDRTRELSELNERLKREVDDRKRAEQQALQANQDLLAALEQMRDMQNDLVRRERFQALAQMANGIAHDFNNVLTPIVGFAEQLMRDPVVTSAPPRILQGLEKIKDAALSGSTAVARVREFARTEAGLMGSVHAGELIENALSLSEPMWKNEAMAAGVTISIERCGEDAPDIFGEEAQLREAVAHVIFNAAHAISRRGVIRLGATTRGNMVAIFVQDTGAGMSAAQRDNCLDPRLQAGALANRARGYAVIHQILARHHGSIEIESAIGKGTTVTLLLPAVPQHAAENVAPQHVASSRGEELRVLIADDEPMVREVTQLYLIELGHTVEVAEDGAEALAKFRAGTFDMVLTDRAMPEMSGDQLAVAVKELHPETPVILLSGFGDAMLADHELPPGVDAVVAKPFTMASLSAAFEEVTQKRHAKEEAGHLAGAHH